MGDKQHLPHGSPMAGVHPTMLEGPESRIKEAIRCYSRWVRAGDLVFDIGANYGEYVDYFHAMSCRVVAVEPQAEIAEKIDPRATVVVKAVGSSEGELSMSIGNVPFLSTFSGTVEGRAYQDGFRFDEQRIVPVTTLDALIAEYGVPAFTKIDVEGWEAEVMNGLSTALPALSFEVHPWDSAKPGAVIERLDKLGDYDYLYADGLSFDLGPWPPLRQGIFGDVYCTLRP